MRQTCRPAAADNPASPRHWWLCSLLALLLVLGSLRSDAQVSTLPDLGDSSSGAFTPLEQERIGRKLMRRIRATTSLVDDPELEHYLEAIGRRLAEIAGDPDLARRFFLINNTTLNAFAAPGGYIGVHTGLFLTAERESELAAVLAHELAHVSQHHLARLVERSKNVSVPAMAAMIAGILVGGQAGAAAVVATNAAVAADSLKYTRNFEREADAIGLATLSSAGFDPAGMTNFFKRMERWARVQEIDVPEFLRTHPLTINRIAEAESRVVQYAPNPLPPSARYQFIRARVRALYSTRNAQAIAEFRANIESGQFLFEDAERYGLALALGRSSRYGEAMTILDGLIAKRPTDQRFVLARAELQLASGDSAAAVQSLRSAQTKWPDERRVKIALADALVKVGNAGDAFTLLEPLSRERDAHARIHQLFARITADLNDPLKSHVAMAEYHYTRDELEAAVAQLFTARKHTGDSFYEASRIEARIQEIQQEQAKYR